MLKISQDFAPPFKLIAPFFLLGGLFYLLSPLYLFTLDVTQLNAQNTEVIAFAHLFLLGFVMMVIFGAMAQLVPVVLEVGHFAVELFYAIWPLLLLGTLLMIVGFLFAPAVLPYGGMMVLISMMIFVVEIFLTMKKVKKLTIVMTSVLLSNTFLFFGILFGLVMALSYGGVIDVNILNLIQAHLYLVVGGYVSITLMGLSVILLPMFGLSHGFSMKPLERALWIMSLSVVSVVFSSVYEWDGVRYGAYIASMAAMGIYFYQIYLIYKTRARKENDVYVKSLFFAYVSMLVALLFGVLYLATLQERFVLSAFWLLTYGLFAFAITGHIYKIIPFLVWFERFSPLVGKQKVPMLADMLPQKSAEAQFVFSAVGVVLVTLAILFANTQLAGAGASFLVVGALAFLRSVYYMINFKG